ncbi:MAG: integrating conjugative element protein [Saccharospirillaceae bacterium]|nr:integrating conjugative element protein [Saccharospirillaceae bacterium]
MKQLTSIAIGLIIIPFITVAEVNESTNYTQSINTKSGIGSTQAITHEFVKKSGLSEEQLLDMRANVLRDVDTVVLKDATNLTPISYFFNTSDPKEKFGNSLREQIISQWEDGIKKMENEKPETKEAYAKMMIDQMFPVVPEKLRSMHLMVPVIKDLPQIQRPIFIIGDNQASLEWLVNNKEELIRYGAEGVLTKVDTYESFQRIQELALPLRLQPVNADFLFHEFGVNGYPLLLTKQGFFQ